MATPSGTDGAGPLPIGIAGPTASGKSALALALAERLPAEIMSVDSALVYRGLDIGSAKPTPAERAAVPHHLIDIRDPGQPYSAAEFVRDASRLIADIRARGRTPLLVGGTMLYFKALRHGLDDMPPADAAVRAQLEAQARQHGWPALHAELARVDPLTAARLPPGDSQRIQRALEVWRLTGRPLSSFHATNSEAARARQTSAWPLFSLETEDRAWLHRRIAERFDAMLAAGFLDEVAALRARRPVARAAGTARRRLPPGLAGAGRRLAAGPAARAGHRRHAPAGQAPAHLAARHAVAPAAERRRPRCPAARRAGGPGRRRSSTKLNSL